MVLALTSKAFANGDLIPRKYTCDGDNLSPPLSWSGLPAGVKSLLLSCRDPDAPNGTFQHWVAYNIPAEFAGLDEGVPRASQSLPFTQAINDFCREGYDGPCPPHAHGRHHYHFRLAALRDRLEDIGRNTPCMEVLERAAPLEITAAELIGWYQR